MLGIVVGKAVAVSRGVTRLASEKRTRRSRFCAERGSEQSGKCSPVGTDPWWALRFREGAEQARKETVTVPFNAAAGAQEVFI